MHTETYEQIYQRMKTRWQEESGAVCDEASDIAIRLRVLAGEIYNMQTETEWLKRQMFPATATGVYLDYFAEQRGLSRREAVKARGAVSFRVAEIKSVPVAIPRGTVVSTTGIDPVRLVTTEDAVLPASTYSVTVPAEAEQAGARGNIRAHTAEIPVSVPAGIDTVTNNAAFRGGADREGDTTLRERIRMSYVDHPNGMNAAHYISKVLEVEGITRAGVMSKPRGAGTVDVYVAGYSGTVSDAKLLEAQTVIERSRGINVDVTVARATSQSYDMTVTIIPVAGYSQSEIVSLCTDAFADYIASIPIGGTLYLGKLGKYLMDTGCVETYVFDSSMTNTTIPATKFFVAGDVSVAVQS